MNVYKMTSLTTLFRWFIRPVLAVVLLVAHFLRVDALPTVTLELVWAFTYCGRDQGSMNETAM